MLPSDLNALIARLHDCDTPTVCNAIEVAQGKRGFDGFTHNTVAWAGTPDARVVGFARTARIAVTAPPTDSPEDTDGDAALGAWWGEIHAQVHKNAFGLGGVVTNGVVRDLGDMLDGFPVLAGSVGPSHGFVHVRDINTPVTIFGMAVAEGDLIHADRHGAVCVPAEVIPRLSDALDRLFVAEAVVLDPLKKGPVTLEAFQALWADFEEARI